MRRSSSWRLGMFAAGEIHHAAVHPEVLPTTWPPRRARPRHRAAVAAGGPSVNSTSKVSCVEPGAVKRYACGAGVSMSSSRSDDELHRIACVVDGARQRQAAGSARDFLRGVRLGMFPVRGIGIQLVRHAGELEIHAQPPVEQQRERSRTISMSRSGCTEVSTSTGTPSKVKPLVSRPVHMSSDASWRTDRRTSRLALRVFQAQPQAPERKPCAGSRAATGCVPASPRPSCTGRDTCALLAHLDGLHRLLELESLGIRKAVPRPLRLGHQRHQRRILLGKGLQPGDVGGEGKIAVAHHEGRGLVDGGEGGIVARHQRVAIDGFGRRGAVATRLPVPANNQAALQ